jgi:hypothetical protein
MSWNVRIALSLLALVFATCLADHLFTVYATPETESPLWKAYNPQRDVERFTFGHSWASSFDASSGAGRGFAHHEKSFSGRFVLKLNDVAAVMAGLRDDMRTLMRDNGGQILEETGSTSTGFYFRYRNGHTIGEGRIPTPLVIDSSLVEKRALCDGEVAVELRSSFAEKWFRSDRDLISELQNPASR